MNFIIGYERGFLLLLQEASISYLNHRDVEYCREAPQILQHNLITNHPLANASGNKIF